MLDCGLVVFGRRFSAFVSVKHTSARPECPFWHVPYLLFTFASIWLKGKPSIKFIGNASKSTQVKSSRICAIYEAFYFLRISPFTTTVRSENLLFISLSLPWVWKRKVMMTSWARCTTATIVSHFQSTIHATVYLGKTLLSHPKHLSATGQFRFRSQRGTRSTDRILVTRRNRRY